MLPDAVQVVADRNFATGFNRIYDRNLAKGLSQIYRRHAHLFNGAVSEPPFQLGLAAGCRTIREFDDALTRVTFCWPSVDAYYAGQHILPHPSWIRRVLKHVASSGVHQHDMQAAPCRCCCSGPAILQATNRVTSAAHVQVRAPRCRCRMWPSLSSASRWAAQEPLPACCSLEKPRLACSMHTNPLQGAGQAEDDPIAPQNAIPYEALEANPRCTLVVTPGGGHLGWGAGPEGPFGACKTRLCWCPPCARMVPDVHMHFTCMAAVGSDADAPKQPTEASLHAAAPWTDNASTEWLNSVVLELYRTGALPTKQAAPDGRAPVGGRQGADRSVEELAVSGNGAPQQLSSVR